MRQSSQTTANGIAMVFIIGVILWVTGFGAIFRIF